MMLIPTSKPDITEPSSCINAARGSYQSLKIHKHTKSDVNVWKPYMWTVVEETNIEAIHTVMNTTQEVVKIRPKNFFRPYFHYYWSRVHNCEDCFHIHLHTISICQILYRPNGLKLIINHHFKVFLNPFQDIELTMKTSPHSIYLIVIYWKNKLQSP